MKQLLLKERASLVSQSLLTDILLLIVIYYLPALSHLMAFPLYMLDPMRIVLFTSIILSKERANTYVLAFTIPIFSCMVGGHPVFVKSLIIALELVANVSIFWFFFNKKTNVFLSCLNSIILAKVIYYLVKLLVLETGALQMELFSTSVIIQVIVAVAISSVMAFVMKSKN